MKQERADLVTRTAGYVLQVRNQPCIRVGGTPASRNNRVILERCIEAWLFLIEDLMLRQGFSLRQRRERSANFIGGILNGVDLGELISFLDSCYLQLVTGETVSDYKSFKHFCESESPSCFDDGRVFSPINRAISGVFQSTGKEKAQFLASIAQFCRFPRKLEFQDIGLEDQALQGYLETEDELASVFFNEDDEVVNSLAIIIQKWFDSFEIKELKPTHGVGSVAEGPLTLAEKFSALRVDKTVMVLLKAGLDPSGYKGYFPFPPETGLARCSRTIFVPKTASKLRTISMEPATLQYLQQGVMWELYRFIRNHPYMGPRIRLDDQGQNQVLAMEGSRFHNYGTIDLSKASDSVSWSLVRRVFRFVPKLYKWLIGTRSTMTLLPNGDKMQLRKFAPMGSALCFPIECLIFAAITEYASDKVCTRLRTSKRLYSVYGDDLVIPSECYDEVVNTLRHCGFTVNTEKSYNSGDYRESCGKEYYAGFDISPLYYRTPFYKRQVSPSAFGSWCSGANNALLHRLPLYRWYLIKKVLSAGTKHGPYFTNTPEASPYIFSPTPTNFKTRRRWSRRYQRWEGRFVSVKSRQRSGELADDTLSYFCKLVEMARRPRTSKPSDEPALPYALHGCIEFFDSVLLPIQPFYDHNKAIAVDWWDT